MASPTEDGGRDTFQVPLARSASISRARRRASFLLLVLSDGRCCFRPCWKFAYQVRPRRKMRTRSPTSSGPSALAGGAGSVAMKALCEDALDELVANDPQVLPDPTGTP